jgi:hypothetical protein
VDELEIRLLRDEDSREELTELLHRAYAELGSLGFRYRAVDQDVAMTRKRLLRGECYVAVHASVIVGTLVELYLRRGYRRVGMEQWEHTNYRSVLLSKRLSAPR